MKLLLPLLILLTTTVYAQERFTSYTVSEPSAWAAWESKDFTRLQQGADVKLVLPAETFERLQQGQLTNADKEAVAASLVSALGIVLPVRTCTAEEAQGETDRVIRTEKGEICRRL